MMDLRLSQYSLQNIYLQSHSGDLQANHTLVVLPEDYQSVIKTWEIINFFGNNILLVYTSSFLPSRLLGSQQAAWFTCGNSLGMRLHQVLNMTWCVVASRGNKYTADKTKVDGVPCWKWDSGSQYRYPTSILVVSFPGSSATYHMWGQLGSGKHDFCCS